MRPSYNRPHYASCPSVCPSVCLSVSSIRARNSKTTKKHKKSQNWYKCSPATSKWSVNFQSKRSKVKVIGRQKPLQQSTSIKIQTRSLEGDPVTVDARQLEGRPHIMSALGRRHLFLFRVMFHGQFVSLSQDNSTMIDVDDMIAYQTKTAPPRRGVVTVNDEYN